MVEPKALAQLGWSGGAMVLGKLPVPGRPTIWITVGQGPTALAVGAGGGCLDIFTLIYSFSPLSPSLWETARYRLKYCLKGPLNLKQPTNQLWLSSSSLGRHSCFLYYPLKGMFIRCSIVLFLIKRHRCCEPLTGIANGSLSKIPVD